jgi:hypothetical protein
MNIDIVRMSASRPDLLRESTASLLKHLKFSGELRWLFHEDVLNENRSKQCIDYINSLDINKVLFKDCPAITHGPSLTKLLKSTKTDYVIHWEDDFLCERDIDLDLICKVLDENLGVNQIAFNKRTTMSKKPGFVKKEVIRSEIKLITNPHWAFTPAIWRMSYIMPKWKSKPGFIHWYINSILKGSLKQADWVIANTGTFFLGGNGEPRFCFHIGFERSLRNNVEQEKW